MAVSSALIALTSLSNESALPAQCPLQRFVFLLLLSSVLLFSLLLFLFQFFFFPERLVRVPDRSLNYIDCLRASHFWIFLFNLPRSSTRASCLFNKICLIFSRFPLPINTRRVGNISHEEKQLRKPRESFDSEAKLYGQLIR